MFESYVSEVHGKCLQKKRLSHSETRIFHHYIICIEDGLRRNIYIAFLRKLPYAIIDCVNAVPQTRAGFDASQSTCINEISTAHHRHTLGHLRYAGISDRASVIIFHAVLACTFLGRKYVGSE